MPSKTKATKPRIDKKKKVIKSNAKKPKKKVPTHDPVKVVQHLKRAKLSPQRELFVKEYFVDFDTRAAAARAGYNEDFGRQLIHMPEVRNAIETGRMRLREKLEVTSERVLRELARIAFADPRNMFRCDGTMKEVIEMDADTAAALASVEVEEIWAGRGPDKEVVGHTKKIRQWDKVSALEKLAKNLGLISDKVDVRGEIAHAHIHAHGQIDWTQIPLELKLKLAESIQKQKALTNGSVVPAGNDPGQRVEPLSQLVH